MPNPSKGMTVGDVSARENAIQHIGDNYYGCVYLISLLLIPHTYHQVVFGLNFTLTYSSPTDPTPEYSHPNQAILNWLSPLNFRVRQNDIFNTRQEGTGEWFLQGKHFQRWVEGTEKLLWCHGIRMTMRLDNNPYRMLTSYQLALERLS
jgi:hypothetical protein